MLILQRSVKVCVCAYVFPQAAVSASEVISDEFGHYRDKARSFTYSAVLMSSSKDKSGFPHY